MPPQRSPSDRSASLRLLSTSRPASVDALIEQARQAERDGRRDLARQLYDRALYRIGDHPDDALSSRLLLWIGGTHQGDGNYGAALDCVEAALATAQAAGDEGAVAAAIHLRADVLRDQGEIADAEREYGEARAAAIRAGDARLAAMTAQDLGACAGIRRDFYSALGHVETSVAELRAIGATGEIAGALCAVGALYTDLQHWEAAERAYGEALQIAAVLGDLDLAVTIELRAAEMWIERKAYESARRSCERAVELTRGSRNLLAQGQALKIWGIVARETGDFALAEDRFAEAERIAQAHGDLLLAADTARENADLHSRRGRHLETLQSLNRAYRLLSQLRARRTAADVSARTGRLERDFLEVVRRWGQSIESKDSYTRGHCERMAGIACAIAARMDFDRRSLFWFRIGALLHDVGKIIIPPELLNKPGRLSADEWAIIRRHPVAGAEMLAEIDFPWDVRPIVEFHHECWDGSGYPHGLAGERIPLAARIVCVADVYDALTTDRSFKAAMTPAEAIEVMRRDVGRQFDPAVFRVIEELVRDRESSTSLRAVPTGDEAAISPPSPAASTVRTDDLTGVLLRGALLDAMTRALDAQRTVEQGLAVLLIDVDHFRRVNDAFGHRQGDDVLWSVAKLIGRAIRGNDVLGRYAGDEFMLLLPETSAAVAAEVAERLRAGIAGLRCSVPGSRDEAVAVTVSIGIASAPRDGTTPAALVAAADRALFSAKRRGGDVVTSTVEGDGVAAVPLPLERFVGRDEELRALIRLLEGSQRGEAQLAVIVGEAGVGKSSLVRELAPEVRLRTGAMLVGRCLESATMSYQPWAEIVGAMHEAGLVPARDWPELSRLVPALAPGARPSAIHERGNRFTLFDEMVELVRAAAATTPLAIVIEDAHWADAASWEMLDYLLARVDGEHILICLTIRAEAAREIAERRRRLAAHPRFHQIGLQPLSQDELKRWIEDVFHQGALAAEFPAFLHQYTDGNPLHVVQALRALHEDGGIWYAGTRWEWRPVSELHLPPAFGDLLARRLERLSPRARAILAAASVIGQTIDPDLVIAAGAGSVADVRGAIDEGVAAAVLEPVRSRAGGHFVFAHALLGDAVRRSLGGRDLQRLHDRTARALELRAPTAVAEIAGHYHAAGDDARAYRYALLASERAATVYAHDDATAFLLVAQRHAPTPKELAEARLRLARVAESAGRYEVAEEMCDLALDWYANEANGRAAIPILRLREHLRGLRGEPPQRLLESGRALLARAESYDDDREQAALLLMLSQLHARLVDWPAAERCARAAAEVTARLKDRGLHAGALLGLGTVLLETRPREALEYFGSALAVCTNLGDRHGQTRCWINAGTAHERAGQPVAAAEAFTVALELGREAHAPDLAGLAALHLGAMHRREGALDQAAERFEESVRLFTAVRNEPHRLAAQFEVAHLARERGDAARALELYDAVAALATRIGQPDVEIGALAGAGLAQLALGDRDAAERKLRDAELLVAERSNWWFQGRELVEALGVRITLAGGHAGLGAQAFAASLRLAETHDGRAALWLVAECAPLLAAAGIDALTPLAERCVAEARAQRLLPLAEKLERHLASGSRRGGSPGSAASGD